MTALEQNRETIAALNHLIALCHDGASGYAAAATKLADAKVAMRLRHFAAEREKDAVRLAGAVGSLAGVAVTQGSASGELHREWLDLIAAIARHDDQRILFECARGEHAAERAFERTLRHELLPDVRDAVTDVLNHVRAAKATLGVMTAG